jgi:hypothetical protein
MAGEDGADGLPHSVMAGEGPPSTPCSTGLGKGVDGGPSPAMTGRTWLAPQPGWVFSGRCLEQRWVQILPVRVHRFDQPHLPGAWPILDVLFPLDRRHDLVVPLKPDLPFQPIPAREAFDAAGAVFVRPPRDVGRHTHLQCAVLSVRHDVDKSAAHAGKHKADVLTTGVRHTVRQAPCVGRGVDADRRRHDGAMIAATPLQSLTP